MNEMERLDIILASRSGISRTAAKALIVSGKVLVNGQPVFKPSLLVSCVDELKITEKMKYVSRGGYKLEKALRHFKIDLTDKLCVDIGASTGGFTDCMLQHGACKVYAFDVGHGQLAIKDERIVSYEKTDIRNIPDGFIEKVHFATVDVSFISLCKIFIHLERLFSESAVCLVKPQFEAGIGVSVKGIKTHERVLKNVIQAASENFIISGLTYSPIKGSDGNLEYLLYLSKAGVNAPIDIKGVTSEAFRKADDS